MKKIIISLICFISIISSFAFIQNRGIEKEIEKGKATIRVSQIKSDIHQESIKETVNQIRNDIHTDADIYITDPIAISEKEEKCLARNIFFESGIEPYEGKIAVAQVTWNRVQSGRWGNDVCTVVKSKNQFSWTRNKNKPTPSGPLWEESKSVAQDFINGVRNNNLKESLHYHANYVNPSWIREKLVVAIIGQHIFYYN